MYAVPFLALRMSAPIVLYDKMHLLIDIYAESQEAL
jgi:hypothetical protein